MNTKKVKETATDVISLVAGVAVGSWLKKQFGGTQLLEGAANNYIVPTALVAAGAVASSMTNNEWLKPMSLGIAAVGGAGLVNELAGRSVVALGNAPSMPVTSGRVLMPRRIPTQTAVRGVSKGGQAVLPGIGMAGAELPGMGAELPGMGKCVNGCF